MTDHKDNRAENLHASGATSGSLFKSAFFALLGAIIVTVLFIMPAEYGVDLTGVGARLGLTNIENSGAESVAMPITSTQSNASNGNSSSEAMPKILAGEFPGAPAPEDFDFYDPEVMGDPFSRSHTTEFRSDTIEVPLAEFEHVEVKAIMKQGDALVYSWKLVEGDTVYTDFHADPLEKETYPEEYWVRYAESEEASASGSIVAPFDGHHGWYWMNIEDNPVKIVLEVRGYYDSLDEIMRAMQ